MTQAESAMQTHAASTAAIEEQIIEMSVLNFERMPMLDVICERFVLSLANALRSYTSAPSEVDLIDLHYTTYANAMLALAERTMIGIAEIRAWRGPVAVAMDSRFLYSALEVMMGGRSTGAVDKPGRGFTRIEARIAGRLCELALRELATAFAQVADLDFELKRMEGTAQLATITQPLSPCVKADFRVAFGGHAGTLSLILPHASVEPIRAQLTKVFYGEKLGGDAKWRGHLSERIHGSSVPVKAVLQTVDLPLGQVLDWAPGQQIDLQIEADHDAVLVCAGVPVARGPMGQRQNGRVAIRISEELEAIGQIGQVLGLDPAASKAAKGDR